MGVAGSGKTTIGKILASRLSLPFFDADDYHSPENKEKMKAGVALSDSDRKGWLATINLIAGKWNYDSSKMGVVTRRLQPDS